MTNEQINAIEKHEDALNGMTVNEMRDAQTDEKTTWQEALSACLAVGEDGE